jgi:enoyl-CoA hydratase/carnithine racemase
VSYEYRDILADEVDGVATITLNRPEQLNAWTPRTPLEIRHAIAGYDSRDDIRVIIVTGAGRAFSAGLDLSPASRLSPEELADIQVQLRPKSDQPYWTMPTPIIAAMNGTGAGGGMTLPMQFDLRIMAEDARYSFIFNRRGLVPELNSTWIVPRIIGTAKALDLLLTGRFFTGAEAVAMGLASEAHPADKVLARANELAREIADNVAPVSAAITKRLVYRHLIEADREVVDQRESALFIWAMAQADAREGMTAFLEKRHPNWTMGKNSDFPHELFGE